LQFFRRVIIIVALVDIVRGVVILDLVVVAPSREGAAGPFGVSLYGVGDVVQLHPFFCGTRGRGDGARGDGR